MKIQKLSNILFTFGLIVIIVGILTGITLGFVTSNGFNLVITITVGMLSLLVGGGCVSVSQSLSEVSENRKKDEEILSEILTKIQNENND